MPTPKSKTTRRARYLYNRALYLERERVWRVHGWNWGVNPVTGKAKRFSRKWVHVRGSKIDQRLVNGATYDGTFDFPFTPDSGLVEVSSAGPRRPPHVSLNPLYPHPEPPKWAHYSFALIGFHKRGVKSRSKRPRDARNTAFNRRITGCNFYYWQNGFFPNDDPLGRRPSQSDVAGGASPDGDGHWPSPLGYV
jgi:hypothetical protein